MLALLCVTSLTLVQQKQSNDSWQPDNRSPLKFAQLGDASMHGFHGIEGHTVTSLEYDGHGNSQGDLELRSPTIFKVGYAWMRYPGWTKFEYPFSKVFVTSNGKMVDVVYGGENRHVQFSASSYKFNDGASVQDWVFGFSRYILGAFRGEHPLTSLLTMALGKPQDYKVTLWHRSAMSFNRPTTEIRTVIYRVPAAAKRAGPLKIEIVADEKTGVPVAIDTSASEPDHKPIHAAWMAAYRTKTFPNSDFSFKPLKKSKA